MGIGTINEEGLRLLVEAFYARVRADEELRPLFNDAIGDWPEHLEKLSAFWSSVMLTTGRYKGQPVPAHMKHRERITPELFDRWLSLWRETTDAMMAPSAAQALQEAQPELARGVARGVLHKNTVSRKISRLSKRVAAL